MTKVLLVDDAAFVRMYGRRILTAAGYEVVEAEDGRDAVNKYATHQPDLVLMDITMPQMDGITATREIHQLDPSAVVILFSALEDPVIMAEAARAGVRDFVRKSFTGEVLLQTVRRWDPALSTAEANAQVGQSKDRQGSDPIS